MPKHLRWLVPSLVLGMSVSANATKVNADDARAIAAEFLKSGALAAPEVLTAKPVHTAGSASNPLYYVFNFTDGRGFVIVSADDCATPVLGFSLESAYPVSTVPDAMQWVMAGIGREIKAAPSVQKPAGTLQLKSAARSAAVKAAEPVLLPTAEWSQEGPFNEMIPGKPLVGCVGTAMATIMKYHQWPAAGQGSFDGTDFNTVYEWSNMRTDNYRNGYTQQEGNAVATLMYHASKSIDTQYAMSGSSAYEVRVPVALSNYFSYDPGVSYKKRSEVATQEAWDRIVKDEIDAGRPVLYCGQDVSAGHAFVCDGYQGDYLHFNWGWGGSANGYFLSTALNPTVSRTHHYNNLNTIIYNIKPASGAVNEWSPIHITADGNQPGIGSDLADLSSGKSFKVRVGNLKNVAYSPFAGKIAVALCSADGKMKALLSNESNFKLDAMAYLFQGFTDFNNCSLPSGTAIENGDMVRLMTLADGSSEWLPVAGELLTVNELLPKTDAPASFNIALPQALAGVTITGENSVIRGWDYSFKAVPDAPDASVVTVKANGYVLAPGADYSYTISNVCGDQEISVLVQDAAEVKEKRSVWVATPGTLAEVLPEDEAANVKELTLFGMIDARDFEYIKSAMRPRIVDLTAVQITANGTNQANAIPREAFRGMGSLEEVILPSSVNRMNNGCFRSTSITRITIPANVKTYEYNVFCGASRLRDIYVGRESAEFINWCVLSGVNVKETTLHVPTDRAFANYNKAENWNTIGNIIVDPIVPSEQAMFAVMENNEVNFECAQNAGPVDKGTKVTFTARHKGETDNRMEVYANNSLLSADADGVYTADINGNTIIHFDLAAPIAIDSNPSAWKLTAANGSIGMLTDAVNVIPGQDFTVRINALEIPEYYDQFYWGMALTDAEGNIKEFISPVNVWTAGAGKNFKMNVNCRVKDSDVREGNQLRLVTSAMKKVWNLVKGADSEITDALPALNNMTPVYSITIPKVEGVNISGAVESAVRGRDITLTMTPVNPAHRLNVTENGKVIATSVSSLNHTFVAMEDVEFEIESFDPKADGVAMFTVAPGTFHNQLTEANVAGTVVVKGELYSSDIQHATGKDFAISTIKTLDLSEATIVAQGGYAANEINHPFFVYTNGMTTPASVVENIILPDNVVKLGGNIFSNCPNMTEITLPKSIPNVPTPSATGKSYTYGIGVDAFTGCPKLRTIHIPGDLTEYQGKLIVAHFNPGATASSHLAAYYNLGHPDAKKVTLVVPEKYLDVYTTAYAHSNFGNPWKYFGYNILSEYPVYGFTYDQTRIVADEDLDLQHTASFLMDNVGLESVSVEGKLRLANPEAKCLVFDNGKKVDLAEDGTIPVTFYNPAKKRELAGNHHIEVINLHDVTFTSASPLFSIKDPSVENESGLTEADFTTSESGAMLSGVAENSMIRFGVDFEPEHSDGLELRVMIGQQELEAGEDGLYTLALTNANRDVSIFAVPTNGATLNAEEIAAINPEEGADITAISFEGDMTSEEFTHALDCFPNLESIDLSDYSGEIPAEAFAGMESLSNIVLPEINAISDNMFNGCTNLASIDIPASVNSIGEGAFKDCSSLESIRLTGIDAIGDNAFSGCDNLTTITILADLAAETETPALKSVKIKSAFGNNAFAGMNPNCIVVLDEGVSQPSATANYIRTASGMISETQPDGSVIEREGRTYSAHSPIVLVEAHPLAIPHTFSLEDGAAVSLETTAANWRGLALPFDVQKVIDARGEELIISSEAADDALPTSYIVYGMDENETDPVRLAAIKANVPCFFYTHENGKVTFVANEGTVPATHGEIKAEGKDYSLHTTYSVAEKPITEVYLLNDDASAFEPASAEEETVNILPFTLYATTTEGTAQILTNLPDPNGVGTDPGTSSVNDIETTDTLRFVKENGAAVVYSPDYRTETLYTADGKAIRALRLQPGRNVIELPGAGLYIVADMKLVF